MTATAVIVGCGAIGRRHLQALAACAPTPRVHVVEPDPASRATAAETARSAAPDMAFTASPDAAGAPARADLAIVATVAAARRAALEALLARCAVPTLLLEKVLFTTRADLAAVGARLEADGIAAFVNCGRRGFPGYDALRAALGGGGPVEAIEVAGAGWGLCSNAIHFIDLAEHLTGETVVALSGVALDPQAAPAKRAGCVELTGALTGRLSGGGTLAIRCDAGPPAAPVVTLRRGDVLWRVDEGARTLTRCGPGDAEDAPEPFAARHVSEMPHLYDELLAGRSRLTPYARSARQHVLALDAFRDRLGLSIEDDAPCPIS
jgi:predicted dehydrogenase